jgi:16S rRNA (guanine(966)-N(2))-methyltransferase RsmD
MLDRTAEGGCSHIRKSASMRVIAGRYRSRPLRSLRGLDIRPTSDRLRETLFDVLTAGNPEALAGSVWLDLFAGTGAVGIEALSRGAAMVYFVESSKRVAGIIQANLQSLGIKESFEIVSKESGRAIVDLERRSVRADYIFLDPPYAMRDAYGKTLNRLSDSSVSKSALIVVEHEKKFDPGDKVGDLQRFRKLLQGDAGLSFYHSNVKTNTRSPFDSFPSVSRSGQALDSA